MIMSDKNQVVNEAEGLFRRLRTKLDELRLQAALGEAEFAEHAQPIADRAALAIDNLKERAGELADDAGEAVDVLKQGFSSAWDEVETAFGLLRDRFSSKESKDEPR